jgi:4,5-DOPA dioxygenase extradiol
MTGSLKDLYNWSQDQKSTHLMPALFIGHGSPMNGIEDNEFSRKWSILGKEIPKPSAVLVVSAHWLTRGTFITAMEHPKTIHDFGGFPKKLFEVQYPAPGNPNLAKAISDLVVSTNIEFDHEWGLDHGTWTVVRHMYPEANIPVLQLSIDYYESPEFHYRLGKELRELRKKGVLVIGSGNMVHNLRMVAWDKLNEPEFGFDWALEMNTLFKTKIGSNDHRDLIDYRNLGHAGKLAIPTPDHYFPLLYLLGIQGEKDEVSFFNDKAVGGSLTMTSVRFG